MRKKVLIINGLLLFWFGLDMMGVNLGTKYLVNQSWQEDGIFFLIYLAAILLFIFKERVGQYVLVFWLAIWMILQFMLHEFYTITGGGDGLKRYFSGSLQWIHSDTRYFPDVYHTILHLLILMALMTTISYLMRKTKAS